PVGSGQTSLWSREAGVARAHHVPEQAKGKRRGLEMSLVTTLWSMQAAAALTLAVLYAVIWSVDRRNLANLTVCVVAVAMSVAAPDELGMMHAATVTEYGEWARLLYLPLFFAFVGQLLFVHLFLGTGRLWLLWTIIGARVVMLLGNFLVYP